jgi:MoaA/NifB/PqqE/SkfB family radical SAM enzyme
LWRFCREHNVFPYFEPVKIQGRAEDHVERLRCTPATLQELFYALHALDRSQYGLDWPVLPPIPGFRCTQIYSGCYVTSQGTLRPCPGTWHHVGPVKLSNGHTNLQELLARPLFPEMRQIRCRLTGPCASCRADPEGLCYGCRACAWLTTGPFGSDPGCWLAESFAHNQRNQS